MGARAAERAGESPRVCGRQRAVPRPSSRPQRGWGGLRAEAPPVAPLAFRGPAAQRAEESARPQRVRRQAPLPPAAPPRSPPPVAPRPRDAAGLRGLAVVVLGAVRRALRATGGQEQDALRARAAGQPRGALPGPGGGGALRPRQLRLTPAPAPPRPPRRDWPRPGCEIPQTRGPGPPASSGSRPSSRIKTGGSHITAALSCVPAGRASGRGGQGARATGLSPGAAITPQG